MGHPHYQATSSGIKSADAIISSTGAYLVGVVLIPDGTNACSIVVYEGTAASGVEVAKLALGVTQTAPQQLLFNIPISCNKGIYCDVTGTGANYIVYYSQGI